MKLPPDIKSNFPQSETDCQLSDYCFDKLSTHYAAEYTLGRTDCHVRGCYTNVGSNSIIPLPLLNRLVEVAELLQDLPPPYFAC